MTRVEAWWAAVPKSRKQRIAAAIDRDETKAAAWLKKNESLLPLVDAGRDSTNVQQYAYFAAHDTRDIDDNDRDGADFAAEFNKDESPKHRDRGTLADEEKARAYLGLTSTLDTVAEESEFHSIDSGTLRSSWYKVEKILRRQFAHPAELTPDEWVRRETNLRIVPTRHQVRGERKSPPKYPTRGTTGMAWDATAGTFREVIRAEHNPYEQAAALEHERRVMHKKSPRRVEVLPDYNEMAPAKPVTYPTGPVREWDESAYLEWLDSRDYDALVAFRRRIA